MRNLHEIFCDVMNSFPYSPPRVKQVLGIFGQYFPILTSTSSSSPSLRRSKAIFGITSGSCTGCSSCSECVSSSVASVLSGFVPVKLFEEMVQLGYWDLSLAQLQS